MQLTKENQLLQAPVEDEGEEGEDNLQCQCMVQVCPLIILKDLQDVGEDKDEGMDVALKTPHLQV